jgi:hypothetical protein
MGRTGPPSRRAGKGQTHCPAHADGDKRRTGGASLGHANASTTLDIYAQFPQAADERAAEALGGLLRSHRAEELIAEHHSDTDGGM